MLLAFNCQNCGARYERPHCAAAKGTRFCSLACLHAARAKEATRDLSERFWEKVEKGGPNDCWPWIGKSISRGGYGAINIDGKIKRAPRVAYELTYGAINDEKRFVRHKCDNPRCTNPSHLELGSAKDNSQDAVVRGRTARNCKVTDAEVIAIRDSTASFAELAEQYGVSAGLIGLIRGKAGHRQNGVTVSRRRELAMQGIVRPRKRG